MGLNQNSGYGQAILANLHSQVGVIGNVFIVMNSANTDEANYQKMQNLFPPLDGINRFYTSIEDAYAACESNNNDVILLDGNSSHALTAVMNVSKNRVHFFGLDGGGRLNSQGAKISIATAVATDIAVINNSWTRNTYQNIKFIQAGTDTACTSALIDSGEGTYVKNCQMEVNTILTTVTQAVLFTGDTCHYEDCQIGNSTVLHNVDDQAPLVIQTPARYSYFINCKFIQYSTKTKGSCIDLPDANSVIGWIIFENCFLLSASKGNGTTAAGTMAEAVTSVATSGYCYFKNCSSAFATAFMEAHASLYSDAVAPAATGWGGISTSGA